VATCNVPLMVARGYSSLSFLHGSAEYIAELDVPAYVYHLGDFDPSGVNAADKIEAMLRELAPAATIYFERTAVLPEQITAWNLLTRPTKASDIGILNHHRATRRIHPTRNQLKVASAHQLRGTKTWH
jgi:hypothetical protein